MTLHDYLDSPGALSVAELAKAIGVKHTDQVRQWRHGYANRKPSAKLCVRIEQATAGAVTRQELRPDDWHEIWPELIPAATGNVPPAAPKKKKASRRTPKP